uniref:Twin-arginine translocation signal domain-containing protein n=1 Tax=Caldiarchaeum subterraneum TaxID=311458 RepID=A0A7C5LEA4_CALS0
MSSVSRRDFIKVAAATATAGAVGSLVSVPRETLLSIQSNVLQARSTYQFVEDSWVASTCLQCPAGCGIAVRVVEDRAVKIEGNPLHPINRGSICPKAHYGLQILYDPDRITGPLVRVGERGSPRFRQASWNEVLDTVASKLSDLRKAGMPERFLWLDGRVRGNMGDFISRFTTSFGTPNRIGHSSICSDGAVIAHYLTQGVKSYLGYDWQNTNYILLFGASFLEAWRPTTRLLRSYGHIRRERPVRAKIVVAEVRYSTTAVKADEWLRINPGTDGALALGIAHVIIRDKMYDREFIEKYTYGFEDFAELVLSKYGVEWAEKVTGLPAETIERVAHEFASTKPAIAAGQRGAMMQPNGVYAYMAIHALNALIGSIGRKGGVIVQKSPPFKPWPPLSLDEIAKTGLVKTRVDYAGTEKYPFAKNVYQQAAESIVEGKPYPVEVLMTYYTNPVFSSPNVRTWERALEKIPFIVSTSPFMDETTAYYADVVLPDHTYLERFMDDVIYPSLGYPVAAIRQPAVKPLYNTANTGDVIIQLARRIGGVVSEAFPWQSFEEAIKYRWTGIWESRRGKVGPLPLSRLNSFEEFWANVLKYGFWADPPYVFEDYKHELQTKTGKFEFHSKILEEKLNTLAEKKAKERGIDFDLAYEELLNSLNIKARGPEVFLPHYEEPEFVGDPSQYPFILATYKSIMHAEGRGTNSPWALASFGPLARIGWRNWVEIHPETAARLGVRDGEWVAVESPAGRLVAVAKIHPTSNPNVVVMPFGIGRTAYGRFASKTGTNVNTILIERRERLSGSAGFTSTRVKIVKLGGV